MFQSYMACSLQIYEKKSISRNCLREIDTLMFAETRPRATRELSCSVLPWMLATHQVSVKF